MFLNNIEKLGYVTTLFLSGDLLSNFLTRVVYDGRAFSFWSSSWLHVFLFFFQEEEKYLKIKMNYLLSKHFAISLLLNINILYSFFIKHF